MSKNTSGFEIIWDQQPSPDADERLLAAFEMIFKGISIELPEDAPFDKN